MEATVERDEELAPLEIREAEASDEPPEPTGPVVGCLLGAAVGDALGLPREGLSRARARRLYGGAPLRYRFAYRRGMLSDDAEHACLVAQALLESGGETEAFAYALARGLQAWFLCGPASIGRTTLYAIARLYIGYPPRRSGVPSATNSPAIRAAVTGVYAADNTERLLALTKASTVLTHTDPRAEQGALLIALAAQHAVLHGPVTDPPAFLATVLPYLTHPQLREFLGKLALHLQHQAPPEEFAKTLGLGDGVSSYIVDTVAVALYCWLHYSLDFRQAVEAAILLGGDTDTTGALVGALAGAALGPEAIPKEWLTGLLERPRTHYWIGYLGERLDACRGPDAMPTKPLPCPWRRVFPRNLLFAALLVAHAGRRLLPPY